MTSHDSGPSDPDFHETQPIPTYSAAQPGSPDPTLSAPLAADQPPGRRRGRRGTVLATAGTLVVAGAFGAGVYLGPRLHRDSAATSSAPTASSPRQGQGYGQLQPPQYGGQPPGFGYGGFGSGGESQSPQLSTQGTTNPASAAQLTGLVRIRTTLGYQGAAGAGTGMVLTSAGEVVTNHHVVAGATRIRATVMSTGKTYVAQVVATDTKDDVAVLKLVGASGLTPVTTSSTPAAVGQKVVAVGDANGLTRFSQAAGKVTALDQHITTSSSGLAEGERLTGMFEISSDVIPGDSGGATYDASGRVVGMTTAASESGGLGGASIDGYAIPIARVLSVVTQIDQHVTSSRITYGYPAFLGVALAGRGTLIQGAYSGTPAAKAGLGSGDRITRIDGTRVRTAGQLRSAVRSYSPGQSVRVTWRDASGGVHAATLTLEQGPVA